MAVGPGGPDRLGQTPQTVAAHDQSVGQAAVSQLGEHRSPLLGALPAGGAQPQPQNVALALKIDPDGHIHGPVGDLGVTDLHDDRVERSTGYTGSRGRFCHTAMSATIPSVIFEIVSRLTDVS